MVAKMHQVMIISNFEFDILPILNRRFQWTGCSIISVYGIYRIFTFLAILMGKKKLLDFSFKFIVVSFNYHIFKTKLHFKKNIQNIEYHHMDIFQKKNVKKRKKEKNLK